MCSPDARNFLVSGIDNMKYVSRLAIVIAAASVAACGGGGGNSGSTPGGNNGPKVASFDYQLDKTTLLNSGLDEATLKVTALDGNNNPVLGAKVEVKVNSGIYTPAEKETDQSGQVTGKISTGSDKANRDIDLTIKIDGKEKSAKIPVTGSEVEVTTNPPQPTPGQSVTLAVNVLDVKKAPIPNAKVEFGGSLGFTGTAVTDNSGKAGATAKAPATPGTYTVEVTASGVTARHSVQVLGASAGVPDAVGAISAAALAITPNTIAPNSSGSSQNRANIRAIFQDAQNKAIKNVRARFEIVEPSLGAGERISSGSDILYTDVNGVVNAEYIAGTRPSPTNGVVIRVCYGRTDAELAQVETDADGKPVKDVNGNPVCKNKQIASMTVASAPLNIQIGDHNKLETGQDGITYIKKFAVSVVDAAGNAVPNAEISANVDLPNYYKGPVWRSRAEGQFRCANEDANRNGLIDTWLDQAGLRQTEDVNGNGVLEPRRADVVLSYVGGNRRTGTNGFVTIQVEYPQSVGGWLDYTIKVTTSVAGSEGTVQKTYVTDVLEADVKNGSFLTPPYGRALDCKQPN